MVPFDSPATESRVQTRLPPGRPPLLPGRLDPPNRRGRFPVASAPRAL